MKRTFMILGGSIGQLAAIKKVKELGMNVLVIDRDTKVVGSTIADYFEPADTTNFSDALETAKKYNIVGSMTLSSDIAVPTSCYINETLKLPIQGVGIGQYVSDKYLMRECFIKAGVNCPKFYKVENEEDIAHVYSSIKNDINERPFIVKPSDSSGSRGVTKVHKEPEMKNAVEKAMAFSRNKKVIIEEYIEGIEFGAQTFSVDGEMKICLMHNDTISPNLIPLGHSFPITLDQDQIQSSKYECAKALKSLGIMNGPGNVDFILSKDGLPYIIEIGARIGATRLPELVKAHTNIDIIELSILMASGKPILIPEAKAIPVANELIWFEEKAYIDKLPDIKTLINKYQPLDYEISIGERTEIRPLLSGVDNYGYVMMSGNSAHDAEARCQKFIKELKNCILLS